jgi:uncharacterized protein
MQKYTLLLGTLSVLFSVLIVPLIFSDLTIIFNGFCTNQISLSFFILGSAIFEEVINRFLIFKCFIRKINIILGLTLQAFIFSVFHYQPEVPFLAFVGYFLGGLIYGISFLSNYRDNINSFNSLFHAMKFPVLLHFSWNFSQEIILGFQNKSLIESNSIFNSKFLGASIFTGGNYGFEGGIYQIFSRLLILFFIITLCYKNNKLRLNFLKLL